mgnify:CR=1 FL=1|tara:strand:- start:7523 stop:8227 length:705 start_codon:yes stop_codon:yes gene_type:complete
MEYPIRINRYLLLNNYCSRRQADRFIKDGQVFINGTVATLGQQVHAGDEVRVGNAVVELLENYQYYLFNKPRGIVSHHPQRDEKSIEDISGIVDDVSVVGRLDKESCGLMLLTNDGRIVNTILNPIYAHQREYEVCVDKYLKESDLRKLARGVRIEGYLTKPAIAKRLGEKSFSLTLTEGKKHQIRRMCAALGYQVVDLKRVRMLHLSLDIKPGEARTLTTKEKETLLEQCGII